MSEDVKFEPVRTVTTHYEVMIDIEDVKRFCRLACNAPENAHVQIEEWDCARIMWTVTDERYPETESLPNDQ